MGKFTSITVCLFGKNAYFARKSFAERTVIAFLHSKDNGLTVVNRVVALNHTVVII